TKPWIKHEQRSHVEESCAVSTVAPQTCSGLLRRFGNDRRARVQPRFAFGHLRAKKRFGSRCVGECEPACAGKTPFETWRDSLARLWAESSGTVSTVSRIRLRRSSSLSRT